MTEPVDAVITWVDGYDPIHQEKITNYLLSNGLERTVNAAPTRYNQHGEINYCVRSILQFAPWIRTIHIVTDGQTPKIFEQLKNTPFASKINLVDHQEIFREINEFLPTFNSLTIESVLWRIKELANQFIYFNDDCMLIRPVNYEDFFRENKIVLRGKWKVQPTKRIKKRFKKWTNNLFGYPKYIRDIPPHQLTQEKSAQQAGRKRYFFCVEHIPFSLNKSTLETFFNQNFALLKNNIQYPFRHSDQFWTISLAQHLEINKRQAIVDNSLKCVTIHPELHCIDKIESRMQRAENNEVAFLCIQSIDVCSPILFDRLICWLNKKIPELSI